MPRGPIRPEDIYEIRQPSHCRVSPDGERLVTIVSQPDKEALKAFSHLWMVSCREPRPTPGTPRRGGAAADPQAVRQFTRGKSSEQNPRWSPDGSTIAFVSSRSGKNELWTMPADGGEARQLTTLKGNVGDFDWHPSGRRLVIAFIPEDAEAAERAEKKKRGEPGAEAPRVREIHRLFYKLDGTGFLPKGRSHLMLVDAETGKARPLTEDENFDEDQPRFSPDGRWIYFVSNRSANPDLRFLEIDIWRMPARGGEIEKIRSFGGPSYNYSLSPDGKWLAFLGTPDPDAPWSQYHVKLWLIPATGGRPVELTANLDRSCENSTISDTFGLAGTTPPVWSPDNRWIYFVVTTEGNSELWRVPIRGGHPAPVIQDPGAVIDYSIDFRGGFIHASFSDPLSPGEIRSWRLPAAEARRTRTAVATGPAAVARPVVRTKFNADWLARREVLLPEEFWFEGSGRHQLQGWILRPRRFNAARKYPGILYIHGGPATQYGHVFFHEFQVLAARGYVVFYCNPRGGTGYSQRHLNAIINRWGTVDYDDLMKFTDVSLRKVRSLDRRRLAVAGGSYGGFMTNWIIGHTHRFACAISSRSISNMMSFVGSSDLGYTWPQEFGTLGPWDDPARYLKMSPLTYLKNMRTPTLIEHQEEDHRCPMEQAEQLWAALKAKGVPVEFLRYPGEPHGMSRSGRPDRRIDRMTRILGWLENWLKG